MSTVQEHCRRPLAKRPRRVTGYRMIESFEVKNFRCFEHVKLNGLKTINVITGANASGKTALLEALYLGANANAVALQNILAGRSENLSVMIGAQGGLPIGSASFDNLFKSKKGHAGADKSQKIAIKFEDNDKTTYDVTISYKNPNDNLPTPIVGRGGGAFENMPLFFNTAKSVHGKGVPQRNTVVVTFNQFGQLQQTSSQQFGPATFIFGANMNYRELDNIAWFSELKARGAADSVVSFLKEEFPFILDIQVLAPNGVSGLYAALSDGTMRKVTLISSGIYKIVSIMLGTAHTHGGIILIDEIENGLFYEKYEAMWKILYKFAKYTENQIFVTSHSKECLAALPAVVGENESDFCLLRAESTGERADNTTLIRKITGTAMKAALVGNNEIRGATIGAVSHNK